MKLLKCPICGNVVEMVEDHGVPLMCCGKPMVEVKAGEVDAAVEKHVPVVKVEGDYLVATVGEVLHPMTPEHYIEWVAIETKFGNQRKQLLPNTRPEVSFALLEGDEVLNVYAYCNLHGLWRNK